jgi:hypothetical protein
MNLGACLYEEGLLTRSAFCAVPMSCGPDTLFEGRRFASNIAFHELVLKSVIQHLVTQDEGDLLMLIDVVELFVKKRGPNKVIVLWTPKV